MNYAAIFVIGVCLIANGRMLTKSWRARPNWPRRFWLVFAFQAMAEVFGVAVLLRFAFAR